MEKNLTTGSVFGNIVRFSLPYLFSYFLQTLYGMADLFIIGQYADASGTTAVSVGSQVMHMLTLMIVGLAMGATVTIGQAVGARDQKSAARYTGNTMTLFLVLSVAVTGLLLALARPIAAVMSTPAEAVSGTVAYLRICFLGVPLITAYNIIASVFRGLGDSKRPMYFIAVACAVNIALDYLFIGALHMGPAGAALGTTLAQAVSVAVSLAVMRGARGGIALTRERFSPAAGGHGAHSAHRRADRAAGRTDPDRVFVHHRHRQPPRPHGRRRRRHRGEDHQLSVPRAVVHALDGVGARRAEHRRGQAPPRAADAVVCHRRRVRLRRAHLGRHPVRRRTGRRALHA